MTGGGTGASRTELASGVAAALAAAEIPPSKLGSARPARLTDDERKLYFWILRRFVTDGRPSRADVRATAARLALDAEQALTTLAGEDLVHRGAEGEITIAYPFSGCRTAHRIRFPGGHEVDAMCAIDALGIAPMFGEPIEIESRDPLSGAQIRARVAPDGAAEWSPESAVVVTGAIRNDGDACCGCCPVLNFFATIANAERWLAEHPQVRGQPITMEEAAAAGLAVFGDAPRRRRRCTRSGAGWLTRSGPRRDAASLASARMRRAAARGMGTRSTDRRAGLRRPPSPSRS